MGHSIYKYPLKAQEHQELELPLGAQILSVQAQRNEICIWALVNTGTINTEIRRVSIYPTGRSSSSTLDREFLGTVQLHGGDLVFHVFLDRR